MWDFKKQIKGWTASFIYTKANAIFHFAGLDEGLAGGNLETDIQEHGDGDTRSDVRVTLFVPDDIDGREDSPIQAERRFKALTAEVLAMGQENSLVFFAQNLISRYSTMYRIYSQQARVLTGRKPTKPIPAVLNLEVEQQTTKDGIIQDVFVSGKPTWHVWDNKRIQKEINRFGFPAFLRECQHEVEQSKEGLMHRVYDDNVHAISYSQFASVYGSPDAWKHWFKVPANDWARTKTKYHANVAGYLAVSSQNTPQPGFTFLVPFSFPADTEPEDVAERLLSRLTPFASDNLTWRELIDSVWKRVADNISFDSVGDRLAFRSRYYQNTIAEYSRPVLAKYQVKTGVNSHSEDKVREMLNIGFGFSFIPSNPKKTEALETIDLEMRVDYTMQHLFDPDKMGYTRWYVLCPDDRTQRPKRVGNALMYPPTPFPDTISPNDLHDEALFRYQMMNRRFLPPKVTELGERIDQPEKLNDDFGQMLQMVYLKRLLNNIEHTTEEVLQRRIAESINFDRSQTEQMTTAQDISQQMARLFAIKEMRKEGYEIDRFGNEIKPDPDDFDYGEDLDDLSEGW